METSELEQIRNRPTALPEVDRAQLAHDLVARLDEEPDLDFASAWTEELTRRLDEVESGTAETVTREELTERLRHRIG